MRVSARLLLLIACCLLPALGLYALIGFNLWKERKAQLADLAVHQAELLAGDIDSITEGARILLTSAGEFHQLRSQGVDCSARLTRLQRNVPSFAFLVYLDAEGLIGCASDPALPAQTDNAWIADAAAATGFTAGHFTRTRLYSTGFVPFYFPVKVSQDGRGGTLIAALDLTWLEQHLQQFKRGGSSFLAGGVLTVADSNGVILARDVRHAEFVGSYFPPAAMPMVHALTPGILRLKSIDGTTRLVAYTPPTPESHNLAVAVGFYEPDLMADIERALWHWGVLLAAVTASVFVLTIVVARRSITRPTRALLTAARRWQEGDLSARAPHFDDRSEFGQLAAAYNTMAVALQCREDKLRAYANARETEVAERTRELTMANERLRAEMTERRSTEAALLQAQKVQAVGQLAGGIAHDFNNILQAVSGSAALVQRRADHPESVRRLGRLIEDAGRRGTSITRRLLAFSRREELRAETLDLVELLHGLHEVLSATLGPGVLVEVDAPENLPFILADRGQLETVLLNLATNARDAMPAGGRLTISAAARDIGPDYPGCQLPAGFYVSIVVADTGEGMDAETLARAAEPFFTTKSLGQGTGLGLALARGFAEGSSGKLSIASEIGQGTKVSLWLPAVARDVRSKDASEPARHTGVIRPGERPSLRLLLVDDDPTVREVLAVSLSDEGYEVVEAEDVPSALRCLDSGPPVHVLITDLAMPGADGLQLIREAQRRQPLLPAILITGYSGSAAELAVGRAIEGRFTILRKPVTAGQLADQVAVLTSGLRETVSRYIRPGNQVAIAGNAISTASRQISVATNGSTP
jgi:signal transduction histidine kinase/CheY-like chemotaxis protein